MKYPAKIAVVASGAAALVAWAVYSRRRRRQLPRALLSERNSRMHSAASVARGRSFAPRASDVFVVTYPKCGTTWMTQICHQLRTGGDEAFGEITEVVPWDVLALDCGQDLDARARVPARVQVARERRRHCARREVHLRRAQPGGRVRELLPLLARVHAARRRALDGAVRRGGLRRALAQRRDLGPLRRLVGAPRRPRARAVGLLRGPQGRPAR